MEKNVTILFLAISTLGFISNGVTLSYIFRSFNIRKHVFSLLFIDSLFSCFCCLVCFVFDILAFTDQIAMNFSFCNLIFLTLYLPINFGAILMMLVSAVRYFLALKSVKNIHPSTAKVSVVSVAIFSFLSSFTCLLFALTIAQDIPFSFLIEDCADRDRRERTISLLSKVVLTVPNLYTVILLLTDVKMLLFLKKTILPDSSSNRRNEDRQMNQGKYLFVKLPLPYM